MTPNRKTLHDISEAELAAYQVRQTGNTCSFHAITTGLRLLLGDELDPNDLSIAIDKLWKRNRFVRVLPGWAVTPRQQVRIIRHLARTRDLAMRASYQHGDAATLPNLLAETESIPIITLVWLRDSVPPIYLGNTGQDFNKKGTANAHTMILAAYDTEHTSGALITPWGFINSWVDNSETLFWMTDADFRKAWGFPLPLVGPNPLVVMRKELT